MLTIPAGVGLYVVFQISNVWFNDVGIFAALVLGGLILCSSLFAMNLGHWYLNVHGLPLSHLRRAVYTFWIFLAIRLLVDVYLLLMHTVNFDGDMIPLLRFMLFSDGFLLWLAVFFGTLFPAICVFFVKGTLDVKNTQAATGILYALLVSVLIGDLTYKYYLIKFGIAL